MTDSELQKAQRKDFVIMNEWKLGSDKRNEEKVQTQLPENKARKCQKASCHTFLTPHKNNKRKSSVKLENVFLTQPHSKRFLN